MTKKFVTKEMADRLMKMKGEVRGLAAKAHVQFMVEKKGEGVFKKVEDRMAELGHPVKYRSLKSMNFYPVGMETLTLLVVKELFDLDEEGLREVGKYQSKVSLIIKLFMKYFASLRVVTYKAPLMWRKYYTVGTLKIIELNEKKNYIILQVSGFKTHPDHCRMLEGYIGNVVKMVVKKKTVCRETKCLFKGDDCHEFTIKW
jgi:hypothetical protein